MYVVFTNLSLNPCRAYVFKLWFIGLNLVKEIAFLVLVFNLVAGIIFLVSQYLVAYAAGVDVENGQMNPRECECEHLFCWCMCTFNCYYSFLTFVVTLVQDGCDNRPLS